MPTHNEILTASLTAYELAIFLAEREASYQRLLNEKSINPKIKIDMKPNKEWLEQNSNSSASEIISSLNWQKVKDRAFFERLFDRLNENKII
jgi:hypothetical protein